MSNNERHKHYASKYSDDEEDHRRKKLKRYSSESDEEERKRKKKHKKRKHRHSDSESDGERKHKKKHKKKHHRSSKSKKYSSDEGESEKRDSHREVVEEISPVEVFHTSNDVIAKLLQLYPKSKNDFRELLEILQEDPTVEAIVLDELEPKAKELLTLLFDQFWSDFVVRTKQGYRMRRDMSSSGFPSLTTLFDTVVQSLIEKKRQQLLEAEEAAAPAQEETAAKQEATIKQPAEPEAPVVKTKGPTLPPPEYTAVDINKLSKEEKTKLYIEEYNKQHNRTKSLVELHQEGKFKNSNSASGSSEGGVQGFRGTESNKSREQLEREEAERNRLAKLGYLAFDREKDMNQRRKMTGKEIDKLVAGSKELNDKFDKTYQTSFL